MNDTLQFDKKEGIPAFFSTYFCLPTIILHLSFLVFPSMECSLLLPCPRTERTSYSLHSNEVCSIFFQFTLTSPFSIKACTFCLEILSMDDSTVSKRNEETVTVCSVHSSVISSKSLALISVNEIAAFPTEVKFIRT